MTVYGIYSHKNTGPVELNSADLSQAEIEVLERLLALGGYPDPEQNGRVSLARLPNARWTIREFRQRDDFEMARLLLPTAIYGATWVDFEGMRRIRLFTHEPLFNDFEFPEWATERKTFTVGDENRKEIGERIAKVLEKYREARPCRSDSYSAGP